MDQELPVQADVAPIVGDQGDKGDTSTPEASTDDLAVAKRFQERADVSRRERRKKHAEWQDNIRRRVGSNTRFGTENIPGSVVVSGTSVATTQSELSPDWELTKTKVANLFSQVPRVLGEHENKQYAAAVSPFLKQFNYEISEKRSNVGAAMEECAADVVNAAGVCAVFVDYAARSVTKRVPVMSPPADMHPDLVQAGLTDGSIPGRDSSRITDIRFPFNRLSPADLLWADNFIGSNFDDADFVGHDGTMPWALAQGEFRLTDEDKTKVSAASGRNSEDDLRVSAENAAGALDVQVKYTELFYWRYRVDPEEPCFSRIWRLVYVEGKKEPAIHEPWHCQEYDETTHTLIGPTRYPIRVGTLVYVSDNAIPPSDTAACRPQVDDMRRSRAQMFMNRERSTPMRWYNVNLVDPLIQEQIRAGVYQGWLPTNGDGARVVGEVARASYPAEDLTFDRTAREDLMNKWMIGPNQGGDFGAGRRTKAETQTVQSNFATLIGKDRGRFTQFFLGACDVLAGLMCRYSDFSILADDEKQALYGAVDFKKINHHMVLTVLPDSTIALDANQQLDRLARLLNLTVQSGFVNPKPTIIKMFELSGQDPAESVIDPQPKEEKPNISFRFSGKDDAMNAAVMALMVHNKMAPDPQDIATAIKILQLATQLALAPAEPAADPNAQPPGPPDAGGPPAPPQLPQPVAHPDWQQAPKVAKRTREV